VLLPVLLAALPSAGASAAVSPHRSFHRLVTGNGHLVASYDRLSRRVDTLLEHPYRFAAPRLPDADLCFGADETRDLAFDLFFGVRARDGAAVTNEWLPARALDGARLEPGTNVVVAAQHAGPGRALEVETRLVAPYTLDAPVVLFTLTLRNVGSRPLTVSPWFLSNLHLGPADGKREPSSAGEEVAWDWAQGALYEYSAGSRGTAALVPLTPLQRASVSGAYEALLLGGELDDVRATAGPSADVVPGLQGAEVTLAPGQETDMAVALSWSLDEDAAPRVEAVKAWAGQLTPAQILSRERDAWEAWHAAAGTPPGLRPHTALLRQGQVREPGPGFGQVMASLPPGLGNVEATWNISWVRDMAYATAAFARSGHLEEARDALLFQLHAPRGLHEDKVGRPYRISLTRYFGNGAEESDCNADGPNVEFDGFGLFLWSAGEYLRAGGDVEALRGAWPVIEQEVADVLTSLVDASGTVRADSSIWEVHWNGKQKKFTYTSLAAARGLCDAALLAGRLGMPAAEARYRAAGAALRDAVVARHTDGRGALAQSVEDLARGHGYLDAAAVEAINWGIVSPSGRVARQTVAALRENLTVAHGQGLRRNDDGDWYDSQEWTFVDLRLAQALAGTPEGAALREWVSAQADANDGYVAELQDPVTADARGSVPMVGFGAGALVLATLQGPNAPACGAYAPEPPDPAPSDDAGTVSPDGGEAGLDGGAGSGGAGGGCGCGASGAGAAWLPGLFMAAAVLGRRRRA
jgi:MYXO-CTERM domain-containing protein